MQAGRLVVHHGNDLAGREFLGALALAFDANPELDEILFNGPHSAAAAVIAGHYRSAIDVMPPLLAFFSSPVALLDWIQDLATTCFSRIDPFFPSAGGNLPGIAARWHALFPPVVRDGPVLCIRRSRTSTLSLDDFLWPIGQRELIEQGVVTGRTLLVSGACGAGKSSFVGAVLRDLLCDRRMIIMETCEELSGISPHFVNLVGRPPNISGAGAIETGWLFREALRIRPDGIVIGEIRGQEASAFLAAAASGHAACLSTIHAGSPDEALSRLGHLAGSSGDLRFRGLVVQLARDGKSKRPAIVDVRGYEEKTSIY